MKKILFTLLFITQISFSQTEKDDYQLYKLILSEKLQLGISEETDSIILIEKFKNRSEQDYNQFELSSDSITSNDINFLLINTHKDTTFIKRLIKEPELKYVINDLTSDLQNNPKITTDKLESSKLKIKTITSDQYYSFLGKKNPWKKIEKSYGTRKIIELSKAIYQNDLASIYYSIHCGNLCGAGNLVVFEKKNGIWQILTEINLWMS